MGRDYKVEEYAIHIDIYNVDIISIIGQNEIDISQYVEDGYGQDVDDNNYWV